VRLVLATHNRDKVREIRDILGGLDVELLSVDEFDGVPEPVEDGETLEANALKKAREIRDFTMTSALADDTGLEVDALDGAPGVYSARYARIGASYQENCEKMLAELDGVPAGERGARFRTVVAVALSEEDEEGLARLLADHPEKRDALPGDAAVDALVAEGMIEGEITTAPRGESGFGYDPLFFDPMRGCTLAEMTAAEKNSTSHRYRALVEMRELLLRLGLVEERG
jgi:XTP/dITP diphosphohydrolase